jgi:hypothetical protein
MRAAVWLTIVTMLAGEVRQYEGTGVSIYELQPDGATPAVMASECGA